MYPDFFSRVPIKRGETAVAIICKKNKNISNIPCYLESSLIPMHIPVIGSMSDYGVPMKQEINVFH